jgi:hypothetical protein
MKRICIFGSGMGVVLAPCSLAIAADLPASLPIKAPVRATIYDWTGFYVGGQVGYGGTRCKGAAKSIRFPARHA